MGRGTDYYQKRYEEALETRNRYYGGREYRGEDVSSIGRDRARLQKIIDEHEIGRKVMLRLSGGYGNGKGKSSQVPFFPRTICDVHRKHRVGGGRRDYNAHTKGFLLRQVNKQIRRNDQKLIREVLREFDFSTRNDYAKRFVNIDAIG